MFLFQLLIVALPPHLSIGSKNLIFGQIRSRDIIHIVQFSRKLCFDYSECPNVNVNFVGLWDYKNFEGFGKYHGRHIGHDVDMFDNVI